MTKIVQRNNYLKNLINAQLKAGFHIIATIAAIAMIATKKVERLFRAVSIRIAWIADKIKSNREDLDKTTSRSRYFSNSTCLQSIANSCSKLVVFLLWQYKNQIALFSFF